MANKKYFESVEEAVFDIQKLVEQYLLTDGITWIVSKLKTNIIRTVYSRKPSDDYDRTDSFRNSVSGRVVVNGKQGNSWNFELRAFPDPNKMEPNHTSWATGQRVDNRLTDWLDQGHGGMGVIYRPAKFIEKTEEQVKDPRGLVRGLNATLRKNGYNVSATGE